MSTETNILRLFIGEDDASKHVSHGLQEMFFLYAKSGDAHAAADLVSKHGTGTPGQSSLSEAKQIEYRTVIQIAILAQAAVEAGVKPHSAYVACDYFLQKTAQVKSVEEYSAIVSDAAHIFCTAIERRSPENSESVHITKAKAYIDEHLVTSFSLQDLADELGVTPTYLASLFSRHENSTLKDYILRLRVQAAENVLRDTDTPIGVIARNLCFSSPSHFGQVFKKYAGVTPTEYRKNHTK